MSTINTQHEVCIVSALRRDPGGVTTHVDLLRAALAADGWDVTFIGGNAVLPPLVRCLHAKIFCPVRGKSYPEWYTECVIERLQARVAAAKPKLVHCHDHVAAVACGRISKDRGFPVIATLHGPASRHAVEHGAAGDSALVRYVESLETEAWSHCQELIAVDSGQERILMEQGAAQDDISVIFNAVDTREIDRSRTATSPFPFPYLLVPRHLVPKNGVEYAIRALSRLADSPVRLISAGDGFLRSQLRRLACGLGIGDRVVFLGRIPRDRVLSLMWHASAVIVPSVSVAGVEEATSFSAIEAMAAGRPVIASAIGGLTELIQDGENGYLVPQKDPGALCAALRAILANPSLAARLGEQARATVLARFSTAQWIPQITAVYQRALRARKELSALS